MSTVLFSLASLLLLAGVAMAQEPANSGICDAAETVGQVKVRHTQHNTQHQSKNPIFPEQKNDFFSHFVNKLFFSFHDQIAGMAGMGAGAPCLKKGNQPEDDWFRANMCKRMNFQASPGASADAAKKELDNACENMRLMMLGNFSLLAAAPLDTSATRKKGNDIVQITETVSWFDNETPVADYKRAGAPASNCQTSPSDWQDDTEFRALIANTQAVDAAACGVSWPADFDAAYPRTVAGMYYYLMDQVFEEFSPTGKARGSGAKPVERKDIRTLSNADRLKYLNAIRATECLGLTKLWGAIHASSPADMHSGPGFLPSHSIFMRIYELSLQTFGGAGPEMGMMIGGWPADETLPRWHNGRIRFSAIWGDDYIGAIADQFIGSERLAAKSAVFTSRVPWDTPSSEADAKLTRSFRNVEQRGGYISALMVWQQLAIEDHMQFSCQIERSLLHGGHHMVISGHMGNLLAASWDAAFFMHHGFVDCVWRTWQMQGPKEARALRTSYPSNTPTWWKKHRADHFAHWTAWKSPKDQQAKKLTHADAYEYRNSGRGSYKCVIPSALPCATDADCGVPASALRDDKRLYCSVAGVCSQYVESNAICRNEYGAFLPCQKTTDRCQYVPSLFAKYNRGAAPANEDVLNAWFCTPSPALECGKRTTQSACTEGCQWVDASVGVQKCSFEVPAFGFGVVESASDTLQPLGAKFDFLDPKLVIPAKGELKVTLSGITATVSAVAVSTAGTPKASSVLSLKRSKLAFGVADSKVGQPAKCPNGGGDYPDQIDRSEGIQIDFDGQVVFEGMKLSLFGSNDIVELQLFDGANLVAVMRYEEPDIIFGASTKAQVVQECPDVDGRKLCRGTRLLVYHASAINLERSSTLGVLGADGKCTYKNPGAAFSLDNVVVSRTLSVKGTPKGTASKFTGYCTGKPGGDYTHCQNQDVCYMSPPTDPTGRPTDVQIILVPAGVCGPKGWVPQIDFVQAGDKINAAYKTKCSCGQPTEFLTGKGPLPAGAQKFRPLLPLSRIQDRAGGNDDANRKDKEVFPCEDGEVCDDSTATPAAGSSLAIAFTAAAVALVAAF